MSKSDSEVISILQYAVAIALFMLETETLINEHLKKLEHIYSLYICLQELRIISFSVVNMTEKLRRCQLDLGCFFSMIGKIYSKES